MSVILENLNQVIYLILGFTISYISLGSALHFIACRLDDEITIKPCIYLQAGKNSNC
ncbi:MAG TPA: hypothetical protein VHJ38_10790 [Nitrososphaeraceae archaeon]|nr:hypothetical protein [Nitrososphaeraceae archaeon]